MSVARTQNITVSAETIHDTWFFWVGLAALALSLVVYGYFVNQAVFAATERIDRTSEIARATERVAQFEFEYNTVRSAITVDDAREKGFAVPLSVHYAETGEKLTQNVTF